MLKGSNFEGFTVGEKIGEGSFGEIYVVRSPDSRLLALKIEPKTTRRKMLEFEIFVLRSISPHPCFPLFDASGDTPEYTWLAMELMGPSLASVARRMPKNQLSLSSGLRAVMLVLKGLRHMHEKGFVHRDLKPSNILLRMSRENPLALIDFGLARVYIDRKTGEHLEPRQHPGFRGTAIYASPNAHRRKELSRRDDMISWFYMVIDLCGGGLPWKVVKSKVDMMHMKSSMSMRRLGERISPQFVAIWDLIDAMEYETEPAYDEIEHLLQETMQVHGVSDADEWDWHPKILSMGKSGHSTEDYWSLPRASNAEQLGEDEEPVFCEAEKREGVNPEPLLGRGRKRNEETCCCFVE